MPDTHFKDKACVVTGAASGIGLALAEALLQAGACVLLADRDELALRAAFQRLAPSHAARLASQVVDVTVAEQVEGLVNTAVERWGRIDLLFNNAGIGGTLPIAQATPAHWQRIVDVNLWSVIHGVQAVLPVMRRQGSGHIVNTASIAGLVPVPGQALYNTTKYAVVGLSESLRLELEADGIAVSVACPGPVASRIWGTPILGAVAEVQAPASALSAEAAAQAILVGVAQSKGLIVLPARERWGWRLYRWWPGLAERTLRTIARQRRAPASLG